MALVRKTETYDEANESDPCLVLIYKTSLRSKGHPSLYMRAGGESVGQRQHSTGVARLLSSFVDDVCDGF